MSSHKCKQCAKPFQSKYNNQAFCSKSCFYRSIASPPHICQTCGVSFQRKGTRQWKYCSKKCAGQRLKRDEIICPVCNQPFHPHKQQAYCSRDCFAVSTRGRRASNAYTPEIKDVIQQRYPTEGARPLSKILKLSVSAIQNLAYKMGITLTPKTRHHLKSKPNKKRMRGSGNPNWQGGVTVKEWGNNWVEQRRACLVRDLQQCQICFTQSRDVHHIIPRRHFIGHMEDANVLTNLITLCPSHHKLVECGKIICPKPKNV